MLNMTKTSSGRQRLTRKRRAALFTLAPCLSVALNLSAGAAGEQKLSARSLPTGVDRATVSRVLSPPPAHTSLRYDFDYPAIGYGDRPVSNSIARLQTRLDRGEVKLKFDPARGYLDSLLEALAVDASSQTLVYSKTSLQIDVIRAATPRAIYFNDDTYVAWVQGSDLLELVVMDANLGPVFYTLPNRDDPAMQFQRETSRCLNCHDTYSMMGGGVPRFLFMSAYVGANGTALTNRIPIDTTDETPLRDRWGGWYVTGQHGDQSHLGNILVRTASELTTELRIPGDARRNNLDTLDRLFDTRPYLTNKSDIVALLVFEHQAYVHNLITRANFKSRTVLAKQAPDHAMDARTWQDLPSKSQAALRPMLEPLVRAMLFVDAAKISSRITSGSGFDAWFQAQGPRDRAGRSLRELDLSTRVFKHPLSFLIYSEGFEGLPDCAKDYVYGRLADIFSGRDQSHAFSHLSAAERFDLMEILADTRPAFAQVASARQRVARLD